MHVVTSETMRRIDEIAIDEMGIPGIDLMHRAGEAIARISSGFYDDLACKGYIGIFAGPGNNGGDGWVCARLLKSKDYPVKVFSVVLPDNLTGDARTAFEEARDAGVDCRIVEAESIDISGMGMAIDALLGTGAKGTPRGAVGEIVRLLAMAELPIIAVDNPTGADADNGSVEGIAIPAIATVSLALPKLGQFLYPAREFVGQLFVADIGIPNEAISRASGDIDYRVDTASDLAALLPFRAGDGHKGTFGKASIIAGSTGMTGAVALSAESALRSGAGLVEAVVPEGIVSIVDSLVLEIITRGVPQVAKHKCLSIRALGDIVRIANEADAIAFGPGIGTHRETVDLTARLLLRLIKPTVIDADALNCIAKLMRRDVPVKFGCPVV
ncbi:MAG TPA: NAD(P)H-hydrate epimerase, partial [candidate division Zixibacteria bacterium]|nr:NAD(P)H-hydrate epimerase [candidate division Zixibacteria bacterium]